MPKLRRFESHDRTARVYEVAEWFRDTAAALAQFYSLSNPSFSQRFALYAPHELAAERRLRDAETERLAALGTLAALEAALREDFILRCIRRGQDPLSRHFRGIYDARGLRASLEEDILEGWKRHSTAQAHVIGQIKGAFKYRHWLAHGRYWQPQLGQAYDFASVYQIAEAVLAGFPLLRRLGLINK